jgi:hypothetical protein
MARPHSLDKMGEGSRLIIAWALITGYYYCVASYKAPQALRPFCHIVRHHLSSNHS